LIADPSGEGLAITTNWTGCAQSHPASGMHDSIETTVSLTRFNTGFGLARRLD
jgi:hypothetical protein